MKTQKNWPGFTAEASLSHRMRFWRNAAAATDADGGFASVIPLSSMMRLKIQKVAWDVDGEFDDKPKSNIIDKSAPPDPPPQDSQHDNTEPNWGGRYPVDFSGETGRGPRSSRPGREPRPPPPTPSQKCYEDCLKECYVLCDPVGGVRECLDPCISSCRYDCLGISPNPSSGGSKPLGPRPA